MKLTRMLVVLTLCCMTSFAFAQDDLFKVLANKGNNEVKAGSSWQTLKIGAALRSGDELKLGTNAYVALVYVPTGKPLELKETRTYQVDALASQIGGGTSVLSKYTEFILSSNAEEKKNRLSATGAVHRALEGQAISIMLPQTGSEGGVYGTEAVVHWEVNNVTGPYVVTLKNMFDDVLKSIETSETRAVVDLSDPALVNEPTLLVAVALKSDPKVASEGQFIIKRLQPAEHQRIQGALSEIKSEVGEPTPLNNLILARFYEENNLVIDAIGAYDEAVRLAPDVTTYKEARDEFLLRQGLKKQ